MADEPNNLSEPGQEGKTKSDARANIQTSGQKSGKGRSKNWGGPRSGSGRRPNQELTLWMQLNVPLTEDEALQVREPRLTPAQRRHRLLYPDLAAVAELRRMEEEEMPPTQQGESAGDQSARRKPYNLRVVIDNPGERQAILSLSVAERRLRLLTPPLGGDIVDQRKGRWRSSDGEFTAEDED